MKSCEGIGRRSFSGAFLWGWSARKSIFEGLDGRIQKFFISDSERAQKEGGESGKNA